ncbi:phage portal protein [Clostridium estertheticum]|uniref:phage portal protein n=1 Tax=Clostridium estertheticum TaxID=238834 RepID=UPI001C0BE6A8|nr:phage portal protein [Clostridium estertheticum]MBU3215861.1 phage portal protein [Clostridium estertheticum]WAG57817.1 phage portal protein [Clostridium estertheticum]
MDINNYIDKVYPNNKETWFADEVEQGFNVARYSNVLANKDYLTGCHKILKKKDFIYKKATYITRKLIINEAKTILNFHSTYLLGKPLSLVGTEAKVTLYEKIYRLGNFNDIDYTNADKMYKYGDSYEYIYRDENKIIKAKVIDSADGNPVYSETNDYVAFIESWMRNNITYYVVYYEDRVETWNNEGGNGLNMTDSFVNLSGLPIHYHNTNDSDENYGESLIDVIKPILDEIEDLLSKMGDSIYTLTLNPLLATVGQPLDGEMNSDAVGYTLALEAGCSASYLNAQMDYSTIKLYLDTLGQKLNMVSHMPSIVSGGNIANVSEVSLKLLYQLADVLAMLSEKSVTKGLKKRFEIFDKLLAKDNIKFTDDEYVGVSFNYSRPQNMTELLDNLVKQFGMDSISKRTIIEKSPLTGDVQQELDRLKEEQEDDSLNLDKVDITDIDNVDNSQSSDVNDEVDTNATTIK